MESDRAADIVQKHDVGTERDELTRRGGTVPPQYDELMVTAQAGDVVLDSLMGGVWMRDDKRFAGYRWIDRELPGSRHWISDSPAPSLANLSSAITTANADSAANSRSG